ncbi:cytochrome b/b6 domain-containing protein [Bradyrhizobium prioriisuperbiae]|uniref:cytochrome b/b6 domain-containing protein n=1 Tax=Bradyrhizobium prioriisuperbiae TaxID=2854389 RepID=UPI0028E609FE|nr:cytochrome b/b6 domain-containing protein [Bradyrhizobium prioritasuperba]
MSSRGIMAWDLPTRMVKWLLAATVVIAWATNRYAVQHPDWHKWNGYAVLVLVVFRLLWGLYGSSTARFSSFVRSPLALAAYVRAQMQGGTRLFLGHNPLGGWMVIALLVAMAAQSVLGLFSAGDDYLSLQGPLARLASVKTVDWATYLHRLGFDVILALATIHVAANVSYDLFRRTGLIRGMITGRKPMGDYVDQTEVRGSRRGAAVCLAAACLIVYGALRLLA